MMFLCVLLLLIPVTQGTETRCEERLDVVSASAWSALPRTYFGRDLLAEAKFVAVGSTDENTSHALLHTKTNETFIRGSSKYFHLYGGDMTRELVEIRGLVVKDMKIGAGVFAAILTVDGVIWTAGRNSHGELGHHGTSPYPVFFPVEGLPPIVQMVVGWYSIVAISRNGTMYSWGHKKDGLGYYSSNTANPTPRPIRIPATLPKDLCCGNHHCAMFTADRAVFTWGRAGRTGRNTDPITPQIVRGIPDDASITKVVCGSRHTLALSSSGRLFGWGQNNHGERLNDTYQPTHAIEMDLGMRMGIEVGAYVPQYPVTTSRQQGQHGGSRTTTSLTGRCHVDNKVTTKMTLRPDECTAVGCNEQKQCSVRDVVAGRQCSIIRTYSSVAEYFGRYDSQNLKYLVLATNMEHARDVMAKCHRGANTMGAVKIGC